MTPEQEARAKEMIDRWTRGPSFGMPIACEGQGPGCRHCNWEGWVVQRSQWPRPVPCPKCSYRKS